MSRSGSSRLLLCVRRREAQASEIATIGLTRILQGFLVIPRASKLRLDLREAAGGLLCCRADLLQLASQGLLLRRAGCQSALCLCQLPLHVGKSRFNQHRGTLCTRCGSLQLACLAAKLSKLCFSHAETSGCLCYL